MFTNNDINFEALKRKAYNGRWAALEDGIIPLTAADPDFRIGVGLCFSFTKAPDLFYTLLGVFSIICQKLYPFGCFLGC
jgi:hypothetical protein